MIAESELLPISGLQHLLFCARQCALIHIEGFWQENRYTADGRLLHERVHSGGVERRAGMRVEFSMPLRSLRLGLVGLADVVEFHLSSGGEKNIAEIPYPVEYKRGKRKKEPWDEVQLCAQALCLEEMLGLTVREGALFYGRERRRLRVFFKTALREKTKDTARSFHALVASSITPAPEYGKKCRSCSLKDACMPKSWARTGQVSRYMKKVLETS